MEKPQTMLIVSQRDNPDPIEKISIDGMDGAREDFFRSFCDAQPGLHPEHITYGEARKRLSRSSADIIIMDLENHVPDARELLGTYAVLHPASYWVVSGASVQTDDLVEFVRLGMTDFLKQPLTPPDLEAFMKRVRGFARSPALHSRERPHRVVSLFSSKGGVGQSFLAVNLAHQLTLEAAQRVVLVDTVLQHGNVAELLDLVPEYTLLDMIQNLERLDLKLLDSTLQKHASGLAVLPCPKQPEEAEFIDAHQTTDLLRLLRKLFQVTILDLGHEMNTVALACLDESDEIWLVATPDLPSLCNTQGVLRTFQRLRYGPEKVKLLLNRADQEGGVDARTLEKYLGRKVHHHLPDDGPLALKAVNQGVPVGVLSPRSDLAKALTGWAGMLVEPPVTEAAS